jgi:alpha-L-fucosidase
MAEPEFTAPEGCRLTQSEDGKRLYIHIYTYPFNALEMDCLKGKVEYAQFLHDGSEVQFKEIQSVGTGGFSENSFTIPVVRPNTLVPVIEVFLK